MADRSISDDCFCNHQFDVKGCSLQGIYKTDDVEKNDPKSLACGSGKITVTSQRHLSLLSHLDANVHL